jgi:AsmA protein
MVKKILIVLFALIIIVIIALAVVIKLYVTPETVKSYLIPEAEKALNRTVELGEVKIGLVKGIQLKDFAIKEDDGKTDFIKGKDFVLKFKLLPLLSKEVIIEEIRLESPEITIRRNTDGIFNYEGIGKERPKEHAGEKERVPEGDKLPISLLVESIAVGNARFSFVDMKKELPDIKGSADIDLGIQSADGSDIYSKGNISIKLVDIVMKKPDEKHIRDITAGLRYEIKYNIQTNSISIDEADMTIQDIPVTLTGNITDLKKSPGIDISLSIPKVKAVDVQKSLLPLVKAADLSLSGGIALDLSLKGLIAEPQSMKSSGKAVIEKLGIDYKGTNVVFDGKATFNEQSMDIESRIDIQENTASLKGSVKSYLKDPVIRIDVYSKHLSLDKLIPAGKANDSSVDEKRNVPGKSTAAEAEPMNLKLTASGEVKIDTAEYANLSMKDLNAQFGFRDNRFEITKLTARTAQGSLNFTGLVDLTKPGYSYNLAGGLDSMHAQELVNSFFPKAKDTVFGILSLNLSLSGAGTKPESIRNNLAGNGDFVITEGKITNSKIPENLALYLGIEELRTINFNEANGTITIRNNKAKLDSIFSSDDISMNPSGRIGLDETIDLEFDLKLSPRLTDKAMLKSNISSYIKDEKGWGSIPLKVSGTFAKPSYGIDIEKAGRRVIKKKAKELIDDLLDKDKETGEQPGESDKPDIQKPLQDLLKGVLD